MTFERITSSFFRCLGSLGEVVEFKNASWPIPNYLVVGNDRKGVVKCQHSAR